MAIDRGLRLADKRSFPADRAKWLAARDAIYEEVMDKGWDAKRLEAAAICDGCPLRACCGFRVITSRQQSKRGR